MSSMTEPQDRQRLSNDQVDAMRDLMRQHDGDSIAVNYRLPHRLVEVTIWREDEQRHVCRARISEHGDVRTEVLVAA